MSKSSLDQLRAAEESNDQIEVLKAQRRLYIDMLAEPDLEIRDAVAINTAMTRLNLALYNAGENQRDRPAEEKKTLESESEFRHFFGKDGVGLDES